MLNKRITAEIKKFHKENFRIKFCLGTIALICVCVALLIIATFTQISVNLSHTENSLGNYLRFEYIPQIPIVLFIAALLGEAWGLASILIYILTGLFIFPVFALGGGPSYIFQYNFGYIFAYIFSVLIVSKQLKGKPSTVNIIKAVIYGVLIIHLIGIIYMFIIALIRHDSFDFIKNWIYYQSLSKLLYDIVFGFIAVFLAKAIRRVLWIIMG